METYDQSRQTDSSTISSEIVCARRRTSSTLSNHLQSNITSFPTLFLQACKSTGNKECFLFGSISMSTTMNSGSPEIKKLIERPHAEQEFNGCETNFACSMGRCVASEQAFIIRDLKQSGRQCQGRLRLKNEFLPFIRN